MQHCMVNSQSCYKLRIVRFEDQHILLVYSLSGNANIKSFCRLYFLVCHAEMNAILNKNSSDVKGCTIYVALFPCNECAKLIIQSGIKRVVYLSDKYRDKPITKASKTLLGMAKVEYV